MLLEAGAEVNAMDRGGNTPLHQATAAEWRPRSTESIVLLLEAGADARAANRSGNTPLHLVVRSSYNWPYTTEYKVTTLMDFVRLLLEAGADANAMNWGGNTPLHYLILSSDLLSDPRMVEVVRLLLEAGADIAAVNNDDQTACDFARDRGYSGMEELLCR